jgi:hypothetical protein
LPSLSTKSKPLKFWVRWDFTGCDQAKRIGATNVRTTNEMERVITIPPGCRIKSASRAGRYHGLNDNGIGADAQYSGIGPFPSSVAA